jgi:type IV pilus assembly protein PilF
LSMNFLKPHKSYAQCVFYVLNGCLLLVFNGCGKKPNQKLAQTYFRMAFNELADDPDDQLACKRALVGIDRALSQEQKPQYLALKATILFKLNDYEKSNSFFKRALEEPSDPALRAEITNNYACLMAHHGNNAKAKNLLQQLTHDATYQTPEVAWVNLGKVYATEHDLSHAQEAFKQAVLAAPSYLDAHYYLGLIAYQQGDIPVAQHEIKLVLALEPDHVGANSLANSIGISSRGADGLVSKG